MAVTTKLQDDANSLLEKFLGYERMNGRRTDKEDAVAKFVKDGVKASVPADVFASFQGKQAPAKSHAG